MEASYTSSRTCINAYATVIITSKLKDSFVSLRMSVGWSVGWLVEPWLGRPQFNDEYVYEFHAVVGFLSTLHRAVQNGKVITTWNIKEFAIVPIERSISRSQSQSRSLRAAAANLSWMMGLSVYCTVDKTSFLCLIIKAAAATAEQRQNTDWVRLSFYGL